MFVSVFISLEMAERGVQVEVTECCLVFPFISSGMCFSLVFLIHTVCWLDVKFVYVLLFVCLQTSPVLLFKSTHAHAYFLDIIKKYI